QTCALPICFGLKVIGHFSQHQSVYPKHDGGKYHNGSQTSVSTSNNKNDDTNYRDNGCYFNDSIPWHVFIFQSHKLRYQYRVKENGNNQGRAQNYRYDDGEINHELPHELWQKTQNNKGCKECCCCNKYAIRN